MFINGHGTYIRDLSCFEQQAIIPPYQAWKFLSRSKFCQAMMAHYKAYPGDEKMISDGLGNKSWAIIEVKGPVVLGLYNRDGQYMLMSANMIEFREAFHKMRFPMQVLVDLMKLSEFA